MRFRGAPSWEIRVDRWAEHFDLALWVRAAERIDVPAGGLVPGPLDIEPLPDATTLASPQFAEGWLAWWQTLVGGSWRTGPDHAVVAERLRFLPPEFSGLADWPVLQRTVQDRWPQAKSWADERKRHGVRDMGVQLDRDDGRVVAAVQRSLGRRVRPFTMELVLLPVLDDVIRPVNGTRFLVPERVYDGPAWPELLAGLLAGIS